MVSGYKINDKTFRRFWFVVSADARVCLENASAILGIARKNGVDDDSITYIQDKEINWIDVQDLLDTPGFFGERLVMIRDLNFEDLSEDDLNSLENILKSGDTGHLAMVLGVKDKRVLSAKKFSNFSKIAEKYGLVLVVSDLSEKLLTDMVVFRAKDQGTVLSKKIATEIVNYVGNDAGMLLNETDKLCSVCGYTEVTREVVNAACCKTVEASVFDIITCICRRNPAGALRILNNLFYLKVDEFSILGALTSSFVDMYRCKTASEVGLSYQTVHDDFEKRSKIYRYQKASYNASAFSLAALEKILALLLDADLRCKMTGADKPLIILSLVAQIMIKGYS